MTNNDQWQFKEALLKSKLWLLTRQWIDDGFRGPDWLARLLHMQTAIDREYELEYSKYLAMRDRLPGVETQVVAHLDSQNIAIVDVGVSRPHIHKDQDGTKWVANALWTITTREILWKPRATKGVDGTQTFDKEPLQIRLRLSDEFIQDEYSQWLEDIANQHQEAVDFEIEQGARRYEVGMAINWPTEVKGEWLDADS